MNYMNEFDVKDAVLDIRAKALYVEFSQFACCCVLYKIHPQGFCFFSERSAKEK